MTKEQRVMLNANWGLVLTNGTASEGIYYMDNHHVRHKLDSLHHALINKLVTTNNQLTKLLQERATIS